MLFGEKRKSKEEKDSRDLVKKILTKGVSLSDEDLEQVVGGQWGYLNEYDYSFRRHRRGRRF